MAQSSFQGFLSPRPDKKGGGNNIKSIQQGTLTFNAGASSVTQAIASVDLTKSILMFDGAYSNAGSSTYDKNCIMGSITSATQLTFATSANNDVVQTIEWKVIEFNNVKSLTSGTATITSGSTGAVNSVDVTIPTVNTSKSMIFASYKWSYTGAVSFTGARISTKFSGSAQITLSSNWVTATTVTFYYFVIEFN